MSLALEPGVWGRILEFPTLWLGSLFEKPAIRRMLGESVMQRLRNLFSAKGEILNILWPSLQLLLNSVFVELESQEIK